MTHYCPTKTEIERPSRESKRIASPRPRKFKPTSTPFAHLLTHFSFHPGTDARRRARPRRTRPRTHPFLRGRPSRSARQIRLAQTTESRHLDRTRTRVRARMTLRPRRPLVGSHSSGARAEKTAFVTSAAAARPRGRRRQVRGPPSMASDVRLEQIITNGGRRRRLPWRMRVDTETRGYR